MTQLTHLARSFLPDGISRRDAHRLIGTAKKEGLTSDEVKELQSLLTTTEFADKFTAQGKATLQGFLTSKPVLAAHAVRIDQRPIQPTGYVADLEKLNALWPADPPLQKLEDAYTAIVDLNGTRIPAPTHLFNKPINIIPYANEWFGLDAVGNVLPRGDAEIAKAFRPGEIGFAIKHHSPEVRTLTASSADLEALKLYDTHIEIVVGTEDVDARTGALTAGAVTVNNPQSYEDGLFGTPNYSMIFVRPKFPDYLDANQVKAFQDNIRTTLVGFNTVTTFPPNYNGGDPLGARTPAEVKTLTEKMIRAVAGDPEAKAWFEKAENHVYCAELAHLATTAGILFPLNKATWGSVVGEEVWKSFEAQLQAHNSLSPERFTSSNANSRVGSIKLTAAPEHLRPMIEYAPAMAQTGLADKMAFKPMTAADIVGHFIRTYIPREKFGEALAPAQAAVLGQMKPALFQQMGLDAVPEGDPRRAAVDALFGRIVEVVGKPHANYAEFQQALEPLMEEARKLTGGRGDGAGLFTPPSMFHVIAQGKNPGGLIDLEYVGHGLHYSVVKPGQ